MALQLTESKFGYIYLYDEETCVFTLNSWSKDVMAECMVVEKQTKYQLEKTGIWGEAVRQRKPIVVNQFEKPNDLKKGYPEGHVQLNRFMTIPVVIDEKIVAVVGLANKVEEYDDNDIYQMTVLMTGVWNARERRERAIELQKANIALKESKDQLQLILDSTAEAIYGIDKLGRCAFCNRSTLKMLGYKHQDELVGKDMHLQIHHSHKDGTPIPTEECQILKAFKKGEGTHVDTEVFWRADGTCFDVEYFSYPQIREGEIVGAVVTFMDISERKKAEEEIRYLSYHDSLTKLYNRMFFEEELKRLDTVRNLPISIIVGDVNGLKLTNDIFGHAAGDDLLKKVAEVFKRVCRVDDIIARVGGDEFVVLLPNTTRVEAEGIILRIKSEFSQEKIIAIQGSISMGCAEKVNADQKIQKIMEYAEDKMYQEKTLNRKSINSDLIKTITETIHKNSPMEKEHSIKVSELCQRIGRAMDFPEAEVRRLSEAGYLHDIGKVVLDKSLLQNGITFSDEEISKFKEHPVVGYRILNCFEDTLDLAEAVLAHHERWDGTGYPKGLKGEEIPMLARIISIAECYDAIMNRSGDTKTNREFAIQEIKEQAGFGFDPVLSEVFIKMLSESI